jgi:CspA family cold shock protein
MSERLRSKVKWFNPKWGYGFIDLDGNDVFIHYSYISMEGYKTLNKGQTVEFDLVETDRGPQAHNVILAE